MNPGKDVKSGAVAEVLEALQAAVGAENVVVCNGECASDADVCVKPKSTEEVSRIIAIARKGKVEVVSSNSPSVAINESLSGAGIFVDLSRMNSIFDIDEVSMSVKVGAGCSLKVLSDICGKKGFTLGAYPFDRSATVGAWAVSTRAGFGSYKYGTSKDNILNLQFVTDSGIVLETGYDNIGAYMSGYNLNQLFSGSEGTLGIVTTVTLKLHPKEINRLTAYSFADKDEMQAAMTKIVQHASIKPRDIAWCGKNLTLVMTLDGTKEYVDMEEHAVDALMTDAKGIKVEKDNACKVCKWICAPRSRGVVEAVAPVKNWKKFTDSVSGYMYGSVLDRGVALFISNSESEMSLSTKAEAVDGRVLTEEYSGWTPSKMADKDQNVSRKVTKEMISQIEEIAGKNNVTTNGVDLLLYSKDMAPLPKEAGMAFKNIPDVVVRPTTVKEISEIVKLAHKSGVPIVPRGNSSWGLGGCMPTSGGIVVDMSSKMNKVIEINTEELYVKVGAGCTWKELLDACMKKGYIIGSYPSSFPSATLGAWIATNGMGVGSYKYGSAKDNILNMEIVLSDGTILETGNNHTGSYGQRYNLNQFFSGSEGTLCVFGTVTFRIYPFGVLKPLVYDYPLLKDIHATLQILVKHPNLRPLHLSFEDEMHFAHQREAGSHAPEVRSVLLVTFQGDKDFVEFDAAAMDVIVALSGGSKLEDAIGEHEWAERCYEFRARRIGVGEIPAEVIVPVSEWGAFTDECYKGFEAMRMEPGGIIGVIVDRNTSLFMPYYFKDDESLLGMTAFAFNFYLGDRAAEYGGRTTGFGVFFAWNLDNIHDARTVAYMRDLKTMLDPRDVVNPGHLVCGNTRFGIKMNKQLMSIGSMLIQTVKKLMPVNTTFQDNKKRFRYNTLEHRREMDRNHKLGDGTQ